MLRHTHTHTHTHTHLKNETNTSFFSEGSLEWMLWDSTVSMATAAHLLPMVVHVCVVKCCVFLFIHTRTVRTLCLSVSILYFFVVQIRTVCVSVCVRDMTSGRPALMDGSWESPVADQIERQPTTMTSVIPAPTP